MSKTCSDELLQTVRGLVKEKGVNEFTISEVVKMMTFKKTSFKESTIRTHIGSKCCINANQNHAIIIMIMSAQEAKNIN